MNKVRLAFFLLLSLAIIAALVWGIYQGHPQDMRMEASTL